jgi:hypothetical protein
MLKRLLHMLGTSPRSAGGTRPDGLPDTKRRFVGYLVLASKVMWVEPNGQYKSGLASTRLRAIIPARELAHAMPVAFVPLEMAAPGPAALDALGSPAALVITKLSTPDVVAREQELESLLDWLDDEGSHLRVCADLADDYAALGREMGAAYPARYQERLGRRCELVVPCEALAQRLAPWAQHGVRVIEDPWETPVAAAPRFAPGETVRLAWFGNLGPMSFDALSRGLTEAVHGARGRAVSLEIVTGEQRASLVERLLAALRQAHPAVATAFTPWSVDRTQQAIAAADIVLLPQDTTSEWAQVKSHNRLVETLRGGRLAVASPIASYVEMEHYAWVGHDLSVGVQWAVDHPTDAQARIAAGQRYVESRFAPSVIGDKWAAALGVTAGR